MNERRALVALVVVAGAATLPADVEAQAFFVDVAASQAFGTDPLPSPTGFSVALGRTDIVGPLGLHAGYRTLHEGGARNIPQVCGFADCTPGPFDQSFATRMTYVGVSYDFPNATDVYLNLGLNVGTNDQIETLVHLDTGSETEDRVSAETSLGGSIDLRLRPLLGPLRPAFNGRYDRIFGGSCAADASCFPDRSVWSVAVGLSWVAGVR